MMRALRIIQASDEVEIDNDGFAAIADGLIKELKLDDSDKEHWLKTRLLHKLNGNDTPLFEILDHVCTCPPGQGRCQDVCEVGAISHNADGKPSIDANLCVDCGLCETMCESGAISSKSACVDLARTLRASSKTKVYAILAPSFVGQFGPSVSPRTLKLALKRLGFTDAVEVALAADITTVREAEEYIEHTDKGGCFFITSACCPAFHKLVDKHRPQLAHLVSHSVSPMVACARLIKARDPQAKVVFIGPCLAKRAESRQPTVQDAVDLVLTYKETATIFEAAGIDPSLDFEMDLVGFAEASRDGRIYARTGGVTEAITNAIEQARPDLEINGVRGNGLKQCAALLTKIQEGHIKANFMEGMACPGGCVGGPGTRIPVELGESLANKFGAESPVDKARDNHSAQTWYDETKDRLDLSTLPAGPPQQDRNTLKECQEVKV